MVYYTRESVCVFSSQKRHYMYLSIYGISQETKEDTENI